MLELEIVTSRPHHRSTVALEQKTFVWWARKIYLSLRVIAHIYLAFFFGTSKLADESCGLKEKVMPTNVPWPTRYPLATNSEHNLPNAFKHFVHPLSHVVHTWHHIWNLPHISCGPFYQTINKILDLTLVKHFCWWKSESGECFWVQFSCKMNLTFMNSLGV